ncbi:hypothetical protein ACTXN4_21305 [Pseudomonas helleri]|uniref:Uncharacterized protein n=1 Tax=Pseudomonas helleri TaxID=1608996 RepID=A0A7X1YAL8_9PSED|nr:MULTISPECIES: hypothetical protein [Pseudomonas]MQT77640.1 hypothetical protein [Pseudomonas helleri]MQT89655.1 hypothetical protein [Pseudomonas helleri]MQT96863.1 hypothetical protein [Pseudomonas helleri]MQU02964.1 hypothetical protein [Pseudomonas sp. FSL R10-2245]MQU33282.1 hypothetical protein [Pseudomonas helleri]
MPILRPFFVPLPPLSSAQGEAGARPGECWEQARRRLEAANYALPPEHNDLDPGADYTNAGPVDECEGIKWQLGELGTI